MSRARLTRRMGSLATLGLLLLPLLGPSRPAGAAVLDAAALVPEAAREAATPPAEVTPAAAPLAEPADRDVSPPAADMAALTGGSYLPLYARDREPVAVDGFRLDRRPVTVEELLAFLGANPEWRRSRVKPVFAGEGYLAGWDGDLRPGTDDDVSRPATGVSWFAAKAYCRWRGARLPTVDEWEYAARADETRPDATGDPAFRARVLALTTTRGGVGFENVWGVQDLHGPMREWVADFNSVMVSDDSRGTSSRDRQLYCAAGATGATDPEDYAAFLRYAFRASLEPQSATAGLGFRCAADLEER